MGHYGTHEERISHLEDQVAVLYKALDRLAQQPGHSFLDEILEDFHIYPLKVTYSEGGQE